MPGPSQGMPESVWQQRNALFAALRSLPKRELKPSLTMVQDKTNRPFLNRTALPAAISQRRALQRQLASQQSFISPAMSTADRQLVNQRMTDQEWGENLDKARGGNDPLLSGQFGLVATLHVGIREAAFMYMGGELGSVTGKLLNTSKLGTSAAFSAGVISDLAQQGIDKGSFDPSKLDYNDALIGGFSAVSPGIKKASPFLKSFVDLVPADGAKVWLINKPSVNVGVDVFNELLMDKVENPYLKTGLNNHLVPNLNSLTGEVLQAGADKLPGQEPKPAQPTDLVPTQTFQNSLKGNP